VRTIRHPGYSHQAVDPWLGGLEGSAFIADDMLKQLILPPQLVMDFVESRFYAEHCERQYST